MEKSIRVASLAPIDVHLCFCVGETLAFWRRNDVNFLELIFCSHFDNCQSCLLFSQHVAEDCAVLADCVLLFHCVCRLNQAVKDKHTYKILTPTCIIIVV